MRLFLVREPLVYIRPAFQFSHILFLCVGALKTAPTLCRVQLSYKYLHMECPPNPVDLTNYLCTTYLYHLLMYV